MSYMTVDMWEEGSKRSSQRSWKTSYLASGAKGKLEREEAEHYWTDETTTNIVAPQSSMIDVIFQVAKVFQS